MNEQPEHAKPVPNPEIHDTAQMTYFTDGYCAVRYRNSAGQLIGSCASFNEGWVQDDLATMQRLEPQMKLLPPLKEQRRQPTPHYVQAGEIVRLELPHSEVCMHMRVAGRVMGVRVQPECRAAQLLTDGGQEFSYPITMGEAGFYFDNGSYYCYPVQPDKKEEI